MVRPTINACVLFGIRGRLHVGAPSENCACLLSTAPFCFPRIRLVCAHQGRDEHMRLILIILIAIIAFGVVQSYRHGCKFGEAGWYDCVMGRTAEAPTPATTETPPPAAPAPAPAPAAPPQ